MAGWFFKKKEEKEEALPKLPALKPETKLKVGLTPSTLKSEVEHVMPGREPVPELPEEAAYKPLPEFPEAETEKAPKQLPKFPDIKELEPEERLFEEESVYEVGKEVEELKHRAPLKPVFVEVEKFKEMLNDLNSAKVALKEGAEIVQKLDEIRLEKDKNFERWRAQLEDIQRKLIFVDKTLFETKYV
jgi:hypothetical protein